MNMQGLHYDLDSLFPENPDFLQEEDVCLKDSENIKRLYPAWIKRISVYVEEYIDRYEYEGSPIYHEYPDKVTVYAMAEDIYYMMADDMTVWPADDVGEPLSVSGVMDDDVRLEGMSQMMDETTMQNGEDLPSDYGSNPDCDGYIYDIIMIMVCNTIYMRRRRHDRFLKCHRFRQF